VIIVVHIPTPFGNAVFQFIDADAFPDAERLLAVARPDSRVVMRAPFAEIEGTTSVCDIVGLGEFVQVVYEVAGGGPVMSGSLVSPRVPAHARTEPAFVDSLTHNAQRVFAQRYQRPIASGDIGDIRFRDSYAPFLQTEYTNGIHTRLFDALTPALAAALLHGYRRGSEKVWRQQFGVFADECHRRGLIRDLELVPNPVAARVARARGIIDAMNRCKAQLDQLLSDAEVAVLVDKDLERPRADTDRQS
jgi:hypothetical protein